MNYKTADSLIAEISGSEFFKDNPNLIDKVSIYRWIFLTLKQFGMNVMQKESKVVEIENYRGQLDTNFGKLALAVFCEKDKCRVIGNKERLLNTYFYKNRIETNYIIESVQKNDNSCAEKKCKTKEKHIIEKFYIHDDCEVELHFKRPCYVKLGRDVLRGACTDDCVNRNVIDSPYSINIKGNTLYANFKEGSLYIEYYGLPQNEDGIPILPETNRGYLEQYVEYTVKRRILEDASMSKDATNLQNMFQYYVGKEQELERKAKSDTANISMKAMWKSIEANRQRIKNYDINLGTAFNS